MDKSIPDAVTWPLSILEAGNWREVYMGTKHMRLEVSYPYEAWERLMAALAAAQHQGQPAPPSAPVGVHHTATQSAEIEALRAEVERANSWNERVSVCRDHVADIVDGPCVICALDAAEARAERLEEALRESADDLERGIDARIVVAQLRARADLLRDQEGKSND